MSPETRYSKILRVPLLLHPPQGKHQDISSGYITFHITLPFDAIQVRYCRHINNKYNEGYS
jgi:hypothetical protein